MPDATFDSFEAAYVPLTSVNKRISSDAVAWVFVNIYSIAYGSKDGNEEYFCDGDL